MRVVEVFYDIARHFYSREGFGSQDQCEILTSKESKSYDTDRGCLCV